jgi:hypothetical protein
LNAFQASIPSFTDLIGKIRVFPCQLLCVVTQQQQQQQQQHNLDHDDKENDDVFPVLRVSSISDNGRKTGSAALAHEPSVSASSNGNNNSAAKPSNSIKLWACSHGVIITLIRRRQTPDIDRTQLTTFSKNHTENQNRRSFLHRNFTLSIQFSQKPSFFLTSTRGQYGGASEGYPG